MTKRPNDRPGLPLWGGLAVPACALWGTVFGAVTGLAFGNVIIGGAIGAGLGVGIGVIVFAAALVKASQHL